MEFDEAVRARRSVRAFLAKEVPRETIVEVFALAQRAPLNCNVQAWLPHIVSGDALRRLRDEQVAAAESDTPYDPDWPAIGKYPAGVYRKRQYDAAAQLYGAMGVARHDLEGRRAAYIRNLAFFDAPHAVFLFMAEPFNTREAVDVGMYVQALILAMTTRGIPSCAQGALSLYPSVVRRDLGLGPELRLLLGVSFGYEDVSARANAARVGRAPLDAAARFHR